MFSTDARDRRAWRRLRDFALAACAAWLVVQNSAIAIALIALRPSHPWRDVAYALQDTFAKSAPLWWIPVAVLAGGALALTLGAAAVWVRAGEERHG